MALGFTMGALVLGLKSKTTLSGLPPLSNRSLCCGTWRWGRDKRLDQTPPLPAFFTAFPFGYSNEGLWSILSAILSSSEEGLVEIKGKVLFLYCWRVGIEPQPVC